MAACLQVLFFGFAFDGGTHIIGIPANSAATGAVTLTVVDTLNARTADTFFQARSSCTGAVVTFPDFKLAPGDVLTAFPTASPAPAPSSSPSAGPAPLPTLKPAPAPTPAPAPLPSPGPTPSPSTPTVVPSPLPTAADAVRLRLSFTLYTDNANHAVRRRLNAFERVPVRCTHFVDYVSFIS